MNQYVLVTGTGREMTLGFNFVRRYLENGDHVIATVRTNPGNAKAPFGSYEQAETLRLLFETKRHDKDGPIFVTWEGEAYPW